MPNPTHPRPSSAVPLAQVFASLLRQRPDATSTQGTQAGRMVNASADAMMAARAHMSRSMAASDSVPSIVASHYLSPTADYSPYNSADRAPAAMQAKAHMEAQGDSMSAAEHLATVLMALARQHGASVAPSEAPTAYLGMMNYPDARASRGAPAMPFSSTRPAGR